MAKDKPENKKEKKRSAEILGIFAAHNFYANGFTPEEMRTTLEDLGPTYVKIGQIMSSRTDVLPENYCKELEKLRQNVRPLDPEIARQVIEEETGKKIDEIFSEFRDEPLGSASIGQAHYAVLKDGTKVVVKVQRPKIAKMMRKDFELLKELAGRKKKNPEEGSDLVDMVEVIEELEKVTNEELDFRIEAANTRFFKENCIPDETKISCPTVIEELTTERIFTMTCVDGYTIAHKDRMIEEGIDLLALGHAICENFLYQVFDVGTFHGDPHQGNLMISKGTPYWIDLGMVGHITEQDINSLTKIVLAILVGDNEGMVDGLLGMGMASAKTDRDKALEDVNRFTDKLAAQSTGSDVTSIADMDVSELFDEITDIAERNYVKLPGDYTMLVRALITIEGVIEELCPELDLLELFTNKMKERTTEDFNLEKKLADAGKTILNAGKKVAKIPGLITDTLSTFTKGKAKLTLDLTGIEEPLEKTGNFLRYVVVAALACVLFLGSCILALVDIQPKTPNGIPLVSVVGIVFAISLAIFAVRKLFKKK